MTRAIWPALALSLTTGCIVYEDPGVPGGPNHAPFVQQADAGCYWDPVYQDDIVYFDATVTDPDGPYGVVSVWADFYDSRTGAWVDTFDLYPTNDPSVWFSDWLGRSTYVDCYYGGYVVDITATDNADATDVLSIIPATYPHP